MLRSLLPFVLGFVPIAVVGVATVGSDDDRPPTTILIVRHAERTDDSANSDLSPAGAERARALVEVAREAVVVVGHSDTVPQLLEAAGRGAFDPVSIDGAYDNLFVVTVGRPRFAPRLVKARYGPNEAGAR